MVALPNGVLGRREMAFGEGKEKDPKWIRRENGERGPPEKKCK
jgi:hypothetical protein